MKFKIGDTVKMTNHGFKFYSNINTKFEMNCVNGVINRKHFERAICGLFAIHGIGVIKGFNDEGAPLIRWQHSLDGIKYHYSHYFDNKDIRKISFVDRLKLIIKRYL